jgi:3-oxoacyl-[acyl-carrier protein] reductase
MRLVVDLTGAVAVVTGAGRRGQVGETVARTLAERGARVLLVDRDHAAATERAADVTALGLDARAFTCDLTNPTAVEDFADQVSSLAPNGLHILVNLAGGYAGGERVADSRPESWQRMLAINLTTAYLATRALLPLLRGARGSAIYFSSAAALPGATVAGMSAYAASKSAVLTLMRAVAAEERDNGVRANALAPTTIRTEANLQSMGADVRYVERETVADWVLWLASPLSAPVTGQTIRLG